MPWAAGEPDSGIIAALDLVGGRSANCFINLGELFVNLGELFAALDLVGGRSANFLVNLGELFGELFD